jgi:hypothetical protein
VCWASFEDNFIFTLAFFGQTIQYGCGCSPGIFLAVAASLSIASTDAHIASLLLTAKLTFERQGTFLGRLLCAPPDLLPEPTFLAFIYRI